MKGKKYRAGIAGLGMIGGADQVSAEAIGQSVDGMDGTLFAALAGHERVDVVAGSSRDTGRRDEAPEPPPPPPPAPKAEPKAAAPKPEPKPEPAAAAPAPEPAAAPAAARRR